MMTKAEIQHKADLIKRDIDLAIKYRSWGAVQYYAEQLIALARQAIDEELTPQTIDFKRYKVVIECRKAKIFKKTKHGDIPTPYQGEPENGRVVWNTDEVYKTIPKYVLKKVEEMIL